MTPLIQAVRQGDLEEIKILLKEALPSSLYDCNDKGQNVFEIAIATKQFLVLSKLIIGLQDKTDKGWLQLLLKKPLPILEAAKLKDPQFFDLLIKLMVGYSKEDLDLIKQERRKALLSERRQGKFSAFLKSACPSKSLADTLNISDTLAGFGFIIGTGTMAFIAIPAACVALLGLISIAYSNYQKLKVEQNLEDETLEKTMLWAQLKNFETNAANPTFLTSHTVLDELQELAIKTQSITYAESYGKQKVHDFLTFKDKVYSVITSLGEILCTSAGLLSMAALALTLSTAAFALPIVVAVSMIAITSIMVICFKNSTSINYKKTIAAIGLTALGLTASLATLGFPLLIFTVTCLSILAITAFYSMNLSKQTSEFAEQRLAQFKLDKKLYKSFKQFKYTLAKALPTSLTLFEEKNTAAMAKKQAIKKAFEQVWGNQGPHPEAFFSSIVRAGNRRWLKFFMINRVPIPDKVNDKGQTLLHLAVENDQLLMVEEMLGLSLSAKDRKYKALLQNPFDEHSNKEKFDAFKLLQGQRIDKYEHYKILYSKTQAMLTVRDVDGHVPLYYAAQLKDPSLYNLLINQGIYQRDDLKEALNQRLRRIDTEKWWALGAGIIESICPGNSLPEIGFSISFIGLVASVSVLNIVFGIASVGIFGLVAWSNYYKNKLERGINIQTEILVEAMAELSSIKVQLEQLKQSPILSLEKEAQMQEAIIGIDSLPTIIAAHKQRGTVTDFITLGDHARVLCSALGTFLCAYAGLLAVMELGANVTALIITGSTLILAGPIVWAFLGIGALGGILVAGHYYFVNRPHDLRIIAENSQNNFIKKEALANLFDLPIIKELLNQPVISPLNSLQQHLPHPNCINDKSQNQPQAQIKEEKKQELSPSLSPIPTPLPQLNP
ncbi:MAG: hypothetical protein H0U75_12200 [Legionella sp.]|nr:hypothetical protein [Legionella sp.]